ncbi:MAG: MGMT family protein [Candidatus Delongbacteria bacterium]|nr:MGMT family protein [Candidatus Delongbacteria bacterium]
MKKLKLPEKGIMTGTAETRFGWTAFALSPNGLKECRFMFMTEEAALNAVREAVSGKETTEDEGITKPWSDMLKNYFDGKIKNFGKIPLDSSSWTDFQIKVYGAVESIPYGKTASYGSIASYLGNEKASRAVGNALKRNPVPPVIPCHRVIAADKELCGFSAVGGIDLKLKLLELEKDNL